MINDDEKLRGKKVLVCDDHVVNINITRKILEKRGILVSYAINGKYALDAFKASEPGTYDAVLMDICMPEMDGNEATRQIRKLDREDAEKIPIIAMTTNVFQSDLVKEKESGMNAHLAKPVRPNELFSILEEYIV